MRFWKKNIITFSSILRYIGISTVCTYVYDNSKCISAEHRGAPLLLWPIIYKLSISYKQLRHIEKQYSII